MWYICNKNQRLEFTERIITTNDSLTLVLVFSFLVLASLRNFYPNRFSDVLQLPLNIKFFTLYGKDEILKHPFNIWFFIFQSLNVSVFIYIFIRILRPDWAENPWLLLQIITFYSVFVTAKISVEKIFANIFSIDETYDQYLFQKMSYRNLISILFFGINLMALYSFVISQTVMWYFLGFSLFLNLISLVSIYRRNRKSISSYFSYFILYLCALEVSPYIILYKLVADISF